MSQSLQVVVPDSDVHWGLALQVQSVRRGLAVQEDSEIFPVMTEAENHRANLSYLTHSLWLSSALRWSGVFLALF